MPQSFLYTLPGAQSLIVSGYWLAASAEDIRETAGRLRSQAQKMLKRATEIETLGLAKFQDGGQRPTIRPACQMAVSEYQMPLV